MDKPIDRIARTTAFVTPVVGALAGTRTLKERCDIFNLCGVYTYIHGGRMVSVKDWYLRANRCHRFKPQQRLETKL